MRVFLGPILVILMAQPTFAAGRPMTVDDLLAVKSVSDPQVSPDGRLVAYVVSEIDRAKNKSNSDVWLVPVAGGEPKRLTSSPGADHHPRWSPDGKSIAFVSDRSGSAQVWLLPIDGGEARQLTRMPIDVGGPAWSPSGEKIVVAAEVYPGKTPEETAKLDQEKSENKSKARAFDSLMIRHWMSWDEGKKSHLFACDARTGEAKDLIPKWAVNVPPGPFGGSEEYAISPDGKEVAFTSEPVKDHAWSTNSDIWIVPIAGGNPRNVTEANPGADNQPSFSPNGKELAYVSQPRAGFEADSWRLMLLNLSTGAKFSLSDAYHIDASIQSLSWVGPEDLLTVVEEGGGMNLLPIHIHRDAYPDNQPWFGKRLLTGGVNSSPRVAPGTNEVVFTKGDSTRPAELYKVDWKGAAVSPLTAHNQPLVSQLDVARAEPFTFPGAGGDAVSGWLIKPPGFTPSKKYPVLFLIHGGPQGAWHDEWHARWNYQLFAAPGYAVVAVNPRGSTGYGQKFTDAISTDWNGKVVEDLMKGLDHALATYPFLDKDRVAAAGGSFGGYMVNWLAGHTDRFKCLISHAGIYDLTSMNSTTEELWFAEWEFGGMPWDQPERYLKQSPSTYAKNFKTPTLVIHGALDFRVPEAQGLAMFTAMQRLGVPSRYLWFPDEGHWITRPANRVVWWNEMHGWLAKYLQ